MLLTNWETPTAADVVELIDWYRARREIETFFHVVKNGCRPRVLREAHKKPVQVLERAPLSWAIDAIRICKRVYCN